MIEINKKWAIGADKLDIILYRTHQTKKGKAAQTAEGYFSTLQGALTELVNQEVRDSDLVSLKELTAKLDEIYALIKSLPNITIADIRGKPIGADDE